MVADSSKGKHGNNSDQVVFEPVESAMFVGFAIRSTLIEVIGLPRADFFHLLR